MGHANRFYWKNWACTVSQPNLCPGYWQTTRSSSAPTSALNFVSSPPMMKPSCPGSSLVIRAGFMVTILRQSKNPPVEKPHVTKAKKAREVKSNVKIMIITFFDVKEVCAQRIRPNRPNYEFRVLLQHFVANAWKRVKKSSKLWREPGCFTMTTPCLTCPSSPSSFWWITKWLSSLTHCTPLI